MEKVNSKTILNRTYSEYILNESIKSIIEKILDSNIKIKHIYLYENADTGLKTFEGSYTVEAFLSILPQIYQDISHLSIDLEEMNERLLIYNNRLVLISDNPNLEIEDLLDATRHNSL